MKELYEKNEVTVGGVGPDDRKFCFRPAKLDERHLKVGMIQEPPDCRGIIALHRTDPEEMDYLFEKRKIMKSGGDVSRFWRVPNLNSSSSTQKNGRSKSQISIRSSGVRASKKDAPTLK